MHSELRNSKKGLINIKNNDKKCFLSYYVRHISPVKIYPERITQKDEKLANDLDYDGLNFLCKKKILARSKRKTIFAVMHIVMTKS